MKVKRDSLFKKLVIGINFVNIILVFLGCNPTTSSVFSRKNVSYDVECSQVVCHNPDSEIESIPSGYAKSCVWCCATYKGQDRKYVALVFERQNKTTGCWYLQDEIIREGVCN